MADNYTFLDASSSVQTAASSVIGGAHRPVVIISSVLTTVPVTFSGNTSVSGTVDIGVIPGSTLSFQSGSVAAVIVGGSVATANSSVVLLNGANVIGSVAALQGTLPWAVAGSVASYPQGTIITSLVSTVPSSVLVGASIIGLTPVSLSGTPSISGTVNVGTIPGSVLSFQAGTQITSLVSTVPSSVIVGASIFGQVPAFIVGGSIATATTNSSVMLLNGAGIIGSVTTLQGTNPWVINGSVSGTVVATQLAGSIMATSATVSMSNSSVQLLNSPNIIGSVATLQGTAIWNIASVYGNISGSVLSQQSGTRTTSVVGSIPSSLLTGNYGFRNDGIASFLGGNLSWNQIATDSAGRILTKAFTPEDGTLVSYASSVTSTSVTLIQGSTIGKRVYVTDFWLSNTGATTTLVTLQDGSTSIMGQFIAPTGGGMSSPGLAVPLKTNPAQDLVFKSNSNTSILYLTLKGYIAP